MAKRKVFISYSRNNYVDENEVIIPNNSVSEILNRLDEEKIDRWIDTEGKYAGDSFVTEIISAIESCDIVIFISSKESNESIYIPRELNTAVKAEKLIIPVRIDDCAFSKEIGFFLPDYIDRVEYYRNHETALNKIVSNIKKEFNRLDDIEHRELLELHEERCSKKQVGHCQEKANQQMDCPNSDSAKPTKPTSLQYGECTGMFCVKERGIVNSFYPLAHKTLSASGTNQSKSVSQSQTRTATHGHSAGGMVGAACGGGIFGMFGAIAGRFLWPMLHITYDEEEVEVDDIPEALKTELDDLSTNVNSSIFAPAEVSRNDFIMLQVYLYKDNEEDKVEAKAKKVDPDAVRKNFTPLDVKLKEGDEVTVNLKLSGKGLELEEPTQKLVWHDHYTDCQFDVYIPEDYKPQSVVGTVMLSVNGVPAGRMMFKSKVVEDPRKLYAEIISNSFKKVFISYSHLDEDKVKFMHEAYDSLNVDHFFDRSYLKPGDVYPEKIKNYINSADLFVLCWSKNAAESDYVQLERKEALALTYPQKDMDKATISIHPISIDPKADLPEDMNKVYNFGEV